MIPANALVTQLQSYLRPTDPQVVQVVDSIQGIQELFAIGEQVRAIVTGQLPTGRFAVLVKDQLLDLNLPRNTEEGAELDMHVVANSPRLTFLVDRPATTELQAQQAPAQNTSSNVALSEAGKFLGGLLSEGASEGEAQAAKQANSAPLVASETIDAAQLANTLKQTLAESGVFYESHLAAWAQGSLDLQSLLREPQGQLSSAPRTESASKEANAEQPHAARAGLPELAAASLQEKAVLDDGAPARFDLGLPAQASGKPLDEMPASIRQLVQQQLQTLDQRAVVWQGQAWQGQPLRWEVEEDRSGRSPDDPAAQTVWHTRLALDLPRLGSVEALVRLTNRTKVDVSFRVASSDTAERIQGETTRLRNRFDAAGLELASQQVSLAQDE